MRACADCGSSALPAGAKLCDTCQLATDERSSRQRQLARERVQRWRAKDGGTRERRWRAEWRAKAKALEVWALALPPGPERDEARAAAIECRKTANSQHRRNGR